MAFILVKRLWHDELIELLEGRCQMSFAKTLLAELATAESAKSTIEHGDICIEVADHHHNLVIDPVTFPFEAGKRVALRTSNRRRDLRWAFTDDYAQAAYDDLKRAVAGVVNAP